MSSDLVRGEPNITGRDRKRSTIPSKTFRLKVDTLDRLKPFAKGFESLDEAINRALNELDNWRKLYG